MSCKKHKMNLIAFLRKELREDEEQMILRHLDECPGCRSYIRFLEDVLSEIPTERSIDPDSFLATRIEGYLRRPSPVGAGKPFAARLIPALVLSLFILAGLFGGFGIGRILSGSQSPSSHMTDVSALMVSDLYEEPMETFFMGY